MSLAAQSIQVTFRLRDSRLHSTAGEGGKGWVSDGTGGSLTFAFTDDDSAFSLEDSIESFEVIVIDGKLEEVVSSDIDPHAASRYSTLNTLSRIEVEM